MGTSGLAPYRGSLPFISQNILSETRGESKSVFWSTFHNLLFWGAQEQGICSGEEREALPKFQPHATGCYNCPENGIFVLRALSNTCPCQRMSSRKRKAHLGNKCALV